MRQYVDADAERLQLGHAFENFGGYSDLVQAERQRQPADAATGDEYGHLYTPVTPWRHDMRGCRGQLRRRGGGQVPRELWAIQRSDGGAPKKPTILTSRPSGPTSPKSIEVSPQLPSARTRRQRKRTTS